MLTTKNLGRNILIALLIAKGTKLLFAMLMRSTGVEVGTYGPVIGWNVGRACFALDVQT